MSDLTEINPYAYNVLKVNYTLTQNDEFDKVAQWSSGVVENIQDTMLLLWKVKVRIGRYTLCINKY